MPQKPPTAEKAKPRWGKPVAVVCLLLLVVGAVAALLLQAPEEPEPQHSDTDVPLGVEQAVIIRYGGPRLKARPYRRGASVTLRIADDVQAGGIRIYDIRYVISLPGEFDLTEYLTSADGRPIDDLPRFVVRGLTSLTKDIETRIQEIENVGVHIWHWYYETLVGLGVFWVAWLVGLIFIGRPKRLPVPPPAPPRLSLVEQIERYLKTLARGDLSVEEKASLEALLLHHWRERLGLDAERMAASCRGIERSRELGQVYRKLQAWLHDPRSDVHPEEFLESYALHAGNGNSRILDSAGP